MRQRVERRLDDERRRGTGLPGEPRPARCDFPPPPLEPLAAGARLEPQGVERALQHQGHACRAGERFPTVRIPGRVGGRGDRASPSGEPGDERVHRAEAVGVEIERERPARASTPAERSRPGRDQAGLGDPKGIQVDPAVGEAHHGRAAVERRPRQERRAKRRAERARGRRGAVPREAPLHTEGEPGVGYRPPGRPVRQIEAPRPQHEAPRAVVREIDCQDAIPLDRTGGPPQLGMRPERVEGARELHRTRDRPLQWQVRDAPP